MNIRQKIFDMLSLPDFDYLVIETNNTINHIRKISPSIKEGICSWALEERLSKLVTIRNYFCFESIVHEIPAYFEMRKEEIDKIVTLLINFKK